VVKRLLSCLIASGLAISLGVNNLPKALVSTASAMPLTDFGVKVLETNGQGLLFEVKLPPLQFVESNSNIGKCQSVKLPGWGLNGEAGEPAVPFRGVLVGIPAGVEPTIEVVQTDIEIVKEPFDLCPIATQKGSIDLDGGFHDGGEDLVIDRTVYSVDREYPSTQVEIGETSFIRSQRVVQVRLQPIQYNPALRSLRFTTRIRVRVVFHGVLPATTMIDEGPFEKNLGNTLINYEQARNWRIPRNQTVSTLATSDNNGGPAYKLAVSQDGIYKVSYAALSAAKAPVDSVDPRNFRLMNQGNEVARYVEGEGDGVFDPSDFILFYGVKNNTQYTDTNIYWLTWGSSTGLHMDASDGTPGIGNEPPSFRTTQRAETNTMYISNQPSGTDQDRWYWDYLSTTKVSSKSYTIHLSHVSNNSTTAIFRGLLKGYAATPRHHTLIYLNNNLVKEDTWPAQSEYSFEVEVPQSSLVEGDNTIKIECPLTGGITQEALFVNWFEVEYAQDYFAESGDARFSGDVAGTWKYRVAGFDSNSLIVFDITNPLIPFRITNYVIEPSAGTNTLIFQQTIPSKHKYIAIPMDTIKTPDSISVDQPSDLHSTSNGADYIIISHTDFLSAIQPLADYHTTPDTRVQVVDLQDVYDEFSGGVFNPNAIHDFLKYAYDQWARPAPSYVLLVGDGNYDFKNYMGFNESNYIPPYLMNVDPWMGMTAADNRYVTVSGDDILPDMALGRLPVKTALETTTMVNKILNYSQGGTGDWTHKITFVADKNDPSAGSFTASSDAIANQVPSIEYTFDKVYSFVTYSTVSATKQAIINTFNDGRLIIHYNGHSATNFWSNDNLFHNTNIGLLTNNDRLPFVVSMTCEVGYYIFPSPTNGDYSSLDESLVHAPNGGAIATWSPTGLGLTSGHDQLDQGLFQALFQDNITELGPATTQAKYYLYANSGSNRELIDTYLLFGDPALQLPMSPTSVNLTYYNYDILQPAGIQLNWATISDTNTLGFNIYRGQQVGGPFIKLNNDLILANPPVGSDGNTYTYPDPTAQSGVTYYYKLEHVDRWNGTSNWGVLTVQFRNTYLPITLR
jgi:hypothetical protein